MAITRQKPSVQIEERTHFIGIYTPKGGEPLIYVLREEVEGDKTHNLGEKARITWAQLKEHPAFPAFANKLGLNDPDLLLTSLAQLCDDLTTGEDD